MRSIKSKFVYSSSFLKMNGNRVIELLAITLSAHENIVVKYGTPFFKVNLDLVSHLYDIQVLINVFVLRSPNKNKNFFDYIRSIFMSNSL